MPEMSLEEQALRHADAFFTGPEKWHRGAEAFDPKGTGAMCVGAALIRGTENAGNDLGGKDRFLWAEKPLGLTELVAYWNMQCPDYAALKAHLRTRI